MVLYHEQLHKSFEFYCDKHNYFPWFMELVENVTRFEKFKLTPEYERQKYESRLWLFI